MRTAPAGKDNGDEEEELENGAGDEEQEEEPADDEEEEPSHAEIARLAYEYYKSRSGSAGDDAVTDWFEAERTLRRKPRG